MLSICLNKGDCHDQWSTSFVDTKFALSGHHFHTNFTFNQTARLWNPEVTLVFAFDRSEDLYAAFRQVTVVCSRFDRVLFAAETASNAATAMEPMLMAYWNKLFDGCSDSPFCQSHRFQAFFVMVRLIRFPKWENRKILLTCFEFCCKTSTRTSLTYKSLKLMVYLDENRVARALRSAE